MADQWDRMFNHVAERSKKIAVAATISAGQSVIFKSPVLTGLFVNNWNMEVNEITSQTTNATSTKQSKINDVALSQLSINLGDYISFCNALPQAVPLEYNHSAKGGAMVRLTAQEWPQHVTAGIRSLS